MNSILGSVVPLAMFAYNSSLISVLNMSPFRSEEVEIGGFHWQWSMVNFGMPEWIWGQYWSHWLYGQTGRKLGALKQKQRSNNTDFHVTWIFLYSRHYQVQSNSFSLLNKSNSYALKYQGPFHCTTCMSKYELTITQNLFLLKMRYQSWGWKCAFNKIYLDEEQVSILRT